MVTADLWLQFPISYSLYIHVLPIFPYLINPFIQIRTLHIQPCLVLIQAISLMRPIRTQDINPRRLDVPTDLVRATSKRRDQRLIILARAAPEPAEDDVLDGQHAGELLAEGEVLLAVALGDLDGVVDVVDGEVLVGDVADAAGAAAALQVAGHGGGGVGPDLDPRAVRGVVHADVGAHDVLDNVEGARVLAQGADGDAVRAVAEEGLDEDGGRIGFEGDAVCGGWLARGEVRDAEATGQVRCDG